MAVTHGTVQLVMPAMGDSVAEGTVLEWRKNVGDQVEVDETVVEISTDKVDAEVPSPVAGTVTKVNFAEGDTVTVGAVLAEISANGDGAAPVRPEAGTPAEPTGPVSTESPPATPEEAAAAANIEAEHAAGADRAAGQPVDIVTPTGGESVTEGTILEWSVKVGETVKQGETVVEVSTDKVDMELPAPVSGTITEILAEEGETVTVGQVIGRMAASVTGDVVDGRHEGERDEKPPTIEGESTPAAADIDASPVARRIAASEGVDLSGLRGSARSGRITKADVLAAASGGNGAGATAPPKAPPAPGATLLKGSAAALARYMDQSRSVPTATSFRTITVTELEQRRAQLKEAGHRVSFTHLIAYAIALVATEDMPDMAHHFVDMEGKPHRVDDDACNLGLAVDVEREDGGRTLMVPVIRDAGRLSFTEFLEAYNALVEKARSGTLTADDLSVCNLSLTNPGGS